MKVKIWEMTEAEFMAEQEAQHGHCLACQATEIPGCPPELRKGVCPECEEPSVYGMTRLLDMGRVHVYWEK